MRYSVVAVFVLGCSAATPAADSGSVQLDGFTATPCAQCMPRCTGPGDAPVDCVNPMTGIVCSACVPFCTYEGVGAHEIGCGSSPPVVCYCDGFVCDPGVYTMIGCYQITSR